jgi:hypothetical protein
MHKSVFGVMAWVAALAVGVAACNSNGQPTDDLAAHNADEEGQVTIVPAGEASAELGVAQWRVEGGAIYGLDGEGAVLAEFHTVEGGVESVAPEAGLLGDKVSEFSPLTRQYYDAFAADAQNATPAGADVSAAVVPSGLVNVNCHASLTACFNERDQIFEETRIVCVCQPPSIFNSCQLAPFTIDLDCNL